MGGVVVFFYQKATTPLTKKHVFFAFRKCGVCFKRVVPLKKATTPPTQTHPKVVIGNLKGYNLTSQVIGLFSRDHQFELYKSQGHWIETYMVVNFRAREISRGTRKLIRTLILIKKKKLLLARWINSITC